MDIALRDGFDVVLLWQNILVDFYSTFVESFRNNKKAHFDCLQPPYNLVDGARTKWCIPQLLDVLIYFHENDTFKPSVRREFNQQKVLLDCLLKELQFQCSGLERVKPERSRRNITINVHVDKITYPWNDVDSVRSIVTQCPPSKSKKKYVEVVNQLCDKMAEIVASGNLTHVIKTVISRLLCGKYAKTICQEQPHFTYSPDFDPTIVANLSADRLGVLAAMEFSMPVSASTPEGRTSDDSSLKEEGCPLLMQSGAKRRSSSIRSVTSVDGEYILGSFLINGEGRSSYSLYSPVLRGCSPLHLQMPSSASADDLSKMYECDSLPDQDMPMDCEEEEEEPDGRKSEFDLYMNSLESSEHTAAAVMFAASPTYFESPRLSRQLIESEPLYERSYSRRSSSRRSSLNTVGSSTTVDSAGSEFLNALGPKLASSLGASIDPHARDRILGGTPPAFGSHSPTSPPISSVAKMWPAISP